MSEGVWERSMTGAMEQSKGRRAMEHRIIFATSNQGKMREIREILKGLGTEILSMKEAGVQADIVEDGDTFEANAVIKAKALSWPTIRAWRWTPWAESRAYIPPDIWEKRPPMRSRTGT